ncbi:hypothetical protein [Sulfurospirillum arcachonense]|uniref:hypothetical protein n=1 Tax=Sulfurospirillum arcachonense TaxID=57666 RepID=UPI0004695FF7|nr:hypothetical protein [Sulfurospirillum arcachonense]
MKIVIQVLYPLFIFFILRYHGIGLNDAIYFKALPLLMSLYVTYLMVISHLKKNSLIVKYAHKFSKKELSENEREYIRKSTLFWIGVSFVNVSLHVVVLLSSNDYYWISYATFGWYFVFIIGGVLQYLHRKFIFLKRLENV